MKRNVNLQGSFFCPVMPRRYQDNLNIISCGVDNYPADNPAYRKRDGFRCSDVALLDSLSYDYQVDSDLVKIVSSRVKELQSIPASNLTEEQMLRCLRPSWVQTASEIKRWDEEVYQFMNTSEIDAQQVEELNKSAVVSDVGESDKSDDSAPSS